MRCYDSCCRPDEGIVSLVLSRRSVKRTRKPHMCGRCQGEIAVGSACQSIALLVDGDFWAEYLHHPYDPACAGGGEW